MSLIFDGGSNMGFPNNPEIRQRYPNARVHARLSRREDKTVYYDGSSTQHVLILNPSEPGVSEVGYLAGEELPDDRAESMVAEHTDEQPQDEVSASAPEPEGLTGIVVEPDSEQNGDHVNNPEQNS